MLIVKEISKKYINRYVLDNVSIYVKKNEVVGLLGPNGAGKTTTFYIIAGMVKPDRGSIEMDGKDITQLPMYMRARLGLGYLPQDSSVFRKLTVWQNIYVILELLGFSGVDLEKKVRELLIKFGLFDIKDSKAGVISGGERRRLEIARVMSISPSYILLDEPFAGLDPIAVSDIQDLIISLKDMGVGVVITDHNVRETLKITDRSYIIGNGRILASGTPEEIVSDDGVKKIYLGEKFEL